MSQPGSGPAGRTAVDAVVPGPPVLSAGTNRERNQAIRDWAKGLEVSDCGGRLPLSLVQTRCDGPHHHLGLR